MPRAMPIFRRKRDAKDEEEPGPSPGTPAEPRKRAGRAGSRARENAALPPPPPPPSAPAAAAPPPLPPPRPPPPATLVLRPDYSECFVCGTTLVGKTCPKCRMTWVE